MTETPAPKPLDGVKVIDTSTYLAGPFSAKMLSDLGAEVIKVESPQGDPYRSVGPSRQGTSIYWLNGNTGKYGVTIDLKTVDGLAAFKNLLADADILIENSRPNVAAKLGIAPADIAGLNPRLVRLSITGYGPDGDLAGEPVYDALLQGRTGLLAFEAADGVPRATNSFLADKIGAAFACQMALAGLAMRERTGKGVHLQSSMLDIMSYYNFPDMMQHRTFVDDTRAWSAPPQVVVPTKDGHMVLSPVTGKQLGATLTVLGHPEWKDELKAIADGRDRTREFFRRIEVPLSTRTTEEWIPLFRAADVPVAPVNDPDAPLADAQVIHNEIYSEMQTPLGLMRTARYPMTIDGNKLSPAGRPRPSVSITRLLYREPELMSADFEPADTMPLAGVVVLDLSRALAAPFCTMMLADLGATIIKVEHPAGGDQSRAWGPLVGEDERTYFFAANRSKHSIAIDLSDPRGAEIVKRLAVKSDVLVKNFMRRSLPRYGLGPTQLTAENPRLIYCSLSGYGRTGLMADRPGYDTVLQAESGIMSVTGPEDSVPSKVGIPISDTIAGMYCAQAILAAIITRYRTGNGQIIDISMLDCSVAALTSVVANALLLGRPPQRYGNGHADIVPQSMYEASDGDLIVHVGTDDQFRRFCLRVLDDPRLAEDPRFATNSDRVANRNILDGIIADSFRQRPKAEWIERLHGADIAAGYVRNVLEAATAPELLDRDMVRTVANQDGQKRAMVISPLRFSATPKATPAYPPKLGEHTDRILSSYLGLSLDEIGVLKADGIIG